ncbi:MAG TPA: hypothetical protein VGO64_05550, partial [Candidatus Limnocylindrales bacterium]|nr:hypothetical protein [Candidatus Limnocylindrales bacterium]
ARPGVGARAAELAAFAAIVALAMALRFVDLATRGTWDADQGHDMLVLRDLVERGVVPLLGPPTSIGDFHHGMLYYLLLAPAALISHADPTAVTAWIAAGGVAAVVVTGWLARSIGGPMAGLIAAGLMAVSATAVEESTFIWNPNLIALSSSIALAAAWRAWATGRPGWWVLAGAGAVVTMQCHVLGVILSPVVAALLVADWSRRRQAGDRRGAAGVVTAAGWWLLLLVLSYLPLVVHEAQTSGSELRAALAWVTLGADPAAPGVAARLPIVGLRVISWPLVGLVTGAPGAALIVSVLVVTLTVLVALPARRGGFDPAHPERAADRAGTRRRAGVRWLGLALAWTIGALTLAASSLATVVPGLPNDHYHAFADPIVFVLVGVGIAAIAGAGRTLLASASPAARLGPVAAAALIVAALASWNLFRQPPRVAADGGWPAAEATGARVLALTGAKISLFSLPPVKAPDALAFPLEQLDPDVLVRLNAGPAANATQVVLCDSLFRETIGADCGGPAEDALIFWQRPAPELVDRFEAAPGRWISIYRPIQPTG